MSVLRVLERKVLDWVEVWINGKLLWAGSNEEYNSDMLYSFVQYLEKAGNVEAHWKVSRPSFSEEDANGDTQIPVNVITNENYYELEWETAKDLNI